MKKLFRRLKNKKGEMLVETMAAILVVTMSSIILLTMISSASDINRKAGEADEAVSEQLIYAEMGADKSTPMENAHEVKITVTGSENEETITIPVDVFRQSEDALYSYAKHIEVE